LDGKGDFAQYLSLLGIDFYPSTEPKTERTHRTEIHVAEPSVEFHEARVTLAQLEREAAGCQRCSLASERSHIVFGSGDAQAKLMFIGEGPGAQEDQQGQPFVGKAGQLLNAIIQAMGLERNKVYITNIVKCRPPENRDPKPGEMEACSLYLHQQIELIKPTVIVALGRVAAQFLLKSGEPLARLRHTIHQLNDHSKLVVTYHPAYLLRSPDQKRKSWDDLKQVITLLGNRS